MSKQSKQRTYSIKNTSIHTRKWPRIIVAICATIFVILGGIWTWRHMTHTDSRAKYTMTYDMPTPARYGDQNAIVMTTGSNRTPMPDINNDRTLTGASDLNISYHFDSGDYAPAMRMDTDAATLGNAIKMTPAIRGKWTQSGPNRLTFRPNENWPSDTTFRIKIARRLFNDDVVVNTRHITFTTPRITGTVDSFDTYPTSPGVVTGVGVISFNYPVNNVATATTVKLNGRQIDANVRMDANNRTAMITTAPITVTPQEQRLTMVISGVTPTRVSAETTIAARDNFFKITNITTAALDDENATPRQLIILSTSAAATPDTPWLDHVHVYLLPRFRDSNQRQSHHWSVDEITPDILDKSTPVTIHPADLVSPVGAHQYAFSYDVSDQHTRYIYVTVSKGIMSDIGFELKNGADMVMRVPYPERSVKIAGDGALLTLNGDRQIGIVARGGVPAAFVNVSKIKDTEINHLISQTYNIFKPLDFKSWSFGVDDMAVVFKKKIPFADASPTRVNYASIDLGSYLNKTPGDRTGIFVIQSGPTQSQADYNDRRLILMTDMGIIRKINANGASSVFVSFIESGAPAANIDVMVLGRNGNAVWTGHTNDRGRADIPVMPFNEYRGAREPVAIVARHGNDVCFIPWDAGGEQMLDYSKFDTGGTYLDTRDTMNAFVFSDRGIYRPGHDYIIGVITRTGNAKKMAGIPVQITIDDPRGHTILDKKISLNSDGMFDIRSTLGSDAALGDYSVIVSSINANGHGRPIGRTTFTVAEFTPDTMKLNATITGANAAGWIHPDNMTADVTLRNLFGTPAQNRRITVMARLIPSQFKFDTFTGFSFTPNIIGNAGLATNSGAAPRPISVELPDVRTDDNGHAIVPIKFDRPIPNGTYDMVLNVRGFDGDGGRHVEMNVSTRVSDADKLIGWRADGNLDFINRGTPRSIRLVAIDHNGVATDAHDLRMQIIARENLTSLVRDASGYYKYQSVARDRVVRTDTIDIPTDGKTISLDTQTPGTYTMQITDANNRIWASATYFIAGAKNITMSRDAAAELKIRLNRTEFAPGDDVAISITAPYTGTGLITIERDRVYAYKWFNASETTSVQHITIPKDFDGSGYINVSFVRDINSRDIFTSPYIYAVAPFTARSPSRQIDVKLTAPTKIDTKTLNIEYNVSQSSRVMIFAVDTGILQVAKYKFPRPLAHFYQKYALGVQTYQILSLILPEYRILREFAKTGGGDYDAGASSMVPRINPFGRRVAAPVAFYSGIINADAHKTGHVTFDIPDYFNGRLDIYAVAANESAMGSASTHTTVISPVIITPSVPLFAAPGDTFTPGVTVTNMTDTQKIDVTVTASNNLGMDNNTSSLMTIDNGDEEFMSFDIHAKDIGPGDVTITAKLDGTPSYTTHAAATLSVRPITPYESVIHTGTIDNQTTTVRRFDVDMYPNDQTRRLYISRGNGAWMRPLVEYLNRYEFDCTEQLTSRALPFALMPNSEIIGTTFNTSATRVNETISKLRARQQPDGSFALWPGGGDGGNPLGLTAYVTEFLMHARDGGFSVPSDMLSRALDYMRDAAGRPMNNDTHLGTRAWAIYLITRGGFITTNYISAFEEYTAKNAPEWETTIAGPFIAAAYQIMKQSDRAMELINQYRPHGNRIEYRSMFDNTVANDAMAAYITKKYFGMENAALDNAIRTYVNRGNYTSYASAMAILGMTTGGDIPPMGKLTVFNGNAAVPGTMGNDVFVADIPTDADTLRIHCDTCKTSPLTWTTIVAGYPRQTHPIESGIEVTRHYYDASGHRITSTTLGRDVTVKITVRAIGDADYVPNVAIVDLLPGALTVVPDTLSGDMNYADIREDRVQIFTDVSRRGHEFTYTATAGVVGDFAVPPISAASMYNPGIRAAGPASRMMVSDETSN